jgi:predicted DNA-binding antitoxin AbrB/MazE fold protein
METINAIYNNGNIEFLDKLNISGSKKIIITFLDDVVPKSQNYFNLRKYWNVFSNMDKKTLKYLAEDKELEYEY